MMFVFLPAEPLSRAAVIAAATGGSLAVVAAALAAVCAWHWLCSPIPLVAWAARLCGLPCGQSAAGSDDMFKVPKNATVQVKHT